MPFPLTQWRTVSANLDAVDTLCRDHGVSFPVAVAMANRGITAGGVASAYVKPRLVELEDPFILSDMHAAVLRIWRAIDEDSSITVFGDYDADGLTATSLLADVIETLGGKVKTFIPERLNDGYGMSERAVARCLESTEPDLIVTVDCGVTAVDAVAHAKKAGVDVVITDHHEPDLKLPDAVAVVNPKRDGNNTAVLAGVGVAFKLCHAMVKMGREEGRKAAVELDLRCWLDLVAVGTVADVVPLTGENRILVKAGLKRLNLGRNRGLAALASQAGIVNSIDCSHIGFAVGPRLNAIGRLGSADPALNLLRARSLSDARALAVELDQANTRRRSIEANIFDQACEQLDTSFLSGRDFCEVASGDGWHAGTIGVVASRLCDRYLYPALVVAFDEDGLGRGSGRSIPGFSLVDALRKCSVHLERFGGHAMAAGITVRREKFEAFRDAFQQCCVQSLKGRDVRPEVRIDAWLEEKDLSHDLVKDLDLLSPIGQGNPAPIWAAAGVKVVGTPRRVGRDASHLKLTIKVGSVSVDAIGFGMGRHELPSGKLDAAFALEINSFRGEESLQMRLVDIRKSEAE